MTGIMSQVNLADEHPHDESKSNSPPELKISNENSPSPPHPGNDSIASALPSKVISSNPFLRTIDAAPEVPVKSEGSSSSSFATNLLNLVGNTPLVSFKKLLNPHKFSCQLYAKCEFKNPTGSSWDRLVVGKISKAIKAGLLPEGISLITGGNPDLCVSLSWAGASSNFPVTVLPGKSCEETKLLLARGYGAHVILSYKQDPVSEKTKSSLQLHINDVEKTSSIRHYPIHQFPVAEATEIYYESLISEIDYQLSENIDMIVCPGEDKGMITAITKKFHYESEAHRPLIIGVDLRSNSFTEILSDDTKKESDKANGNGEVVKWITVTDAEAYDMARRLVREEGLIVGPVSGAVVAAAVKALEDYKLEKKDAAKILTILPDNLMNTSKDFLSAQWMINKKYYNPSHLESLYWWYDMALENISPPVIMIVPPSVPIRKIWSAMRETSTQRAVVAEQKTVHGIVTYDILTSHVNKVHGENLQVKDICHKKFGIIDSKASFRDLELLLQKYNWVINVHRVTVYYGGEESPQISEDVIGIINLADFMSYKRAIEGHHLSAYGMLMSDGIPSGVWLESFKEHATIMTPIQESSSKGEISNEDASSSTTLMPDSSASASSSIGDA